MLMAHRLDVRRWVGGQVIHKRKRKDLDGQQGKHLPIVMMLVYTKECILHSPM